MTIDAKFRVPDDTPNEFSVMMLQHLHTELMGMEKDKSPFRVL